MWISHTAIGGVAACSLDRCSISVGLSVVTKKTVDGFLRFCIYAWFSDDFLQPRCFPRDLYAVNIAENVECIFLSLPFSSSDVAWSWKVVPRVLSLSSIVFFCETTCEFAMMQLPWVIPVWSHRAITCTCLRIYLNFFCNALRERMTNAYAHTFDHR